MVLGDSFFEKIQTAHGTLIAQTVAVEAVSDLALLGSPDGQHFPEETAAFEKFCENTKPLSLCRRQFELDHGVSVYIYDHLGKWIRGTAKRFSPEAHVMWVKEDEQFAGGSSGGPVINESGELLGILSNASEGRAECDGNIFRPHLALPVWAVQRIVGSNLRYALRRRRGSMNEYSGRQVSIQVECLNGFKVALPDGIKRIVKP